MLIIGRYTESDIWIFGELIGRLSEGRSNSVHAPSLQNGWPELTKRRSPSSIGGCAPGGRRHRGNPWALDQFLEYRYCLERSEATSAAHADAASPELILGRGALLFLGQRLARSWERRGHSALKIISEVSGFAQRSFCWLPSQCGNFIGKAADAT